MTYSSALDLATARHRLGLSRSQTISLLDVSQRRYRRWESGRETIPAGVASDLARIEARTAHAVAELVDTWMQTDQPEPVQIGPATDDEGFWQAHPDQHPMPASWWWMVVDRARRYGVQVTVEPEWT